MTQRVHVYIATTKGLVAVQNIRELGDPDIQSVVTVNGSATVAPISMAYHGFVQKSTGVIASAFGGTSYRLNLSQTIDQGSSWQLGVYVAHLCYSRGILADGEPAPGDHVIMTTGAVNTSSYKLIQIQHMAQKCRLAQGQIEAWKSAQISCEFWMPPPNLAEAGPLLMCPSTGISSLSEIEQLSQERTCLSGQNSMRSLASVRPTTAIEEGDNKLVGLGSRQSSRPKPFSELSASANSKTKAYGLAALLIALLLGFAWQTLVGQSDAISSERPLASEGARILAYHQGFGCGVSDTASALGALPIEYDLPKVQGTHSLPAQALSSLCELSLLTRNTVSSVWLVSGNRAVLLLQGRSSLSLNSTTLWRMPLPEYKQQSRQYTLVLSEAPLDLADFASFKDYLLSLPDGQQVGVGEVSRWFTQQQKDVAYIFQPLLVNNNIDL